MRPLLAFGPRIFKLYNVLLRPVRSTTTTCLNCQRLQQNFKPSQANLLYYFIVKRNFQTNFRLNQRKRPSALDKKPKDEKPKKLGIPKISDIRKLMLLAKDEKYRLLGTICFSLLTVRSI